MAEKDRPSREEIEAVARLNHLMRTRGSDPTAPIPEAYAALQRAEARRRRGESPPTANTTPSGGKKSNGEVVIGVGIASLTALGAAFGGGEARAVVPFSIQPTGTEQDHVRVVKDLLPQNGVLVDLSKQPQRPLPITRR
jgi:hypothetical protein